MQKSRGWSGWGSGRGVFGGLVGVLVGWEGVVGSGIGGWGGVGYRECEPRIEGFVKCTYRYCTILRIKKSGGRGGGALYEPKTLSSNLKKKNKKKTKKKTNNNTKTLTEKGLEPTTFGLENH